MSAKFNSTTQRGISRPSEFGGVSRKLSSPGFFNWLQPHINSSDLESILKAEGNTNEKLGILDEIFSRATLPDSFMSDSYRNECMEFLKKLEFKAAQAFPHLVSDGTLAKLKLSKVKVTRTKVKKPKIELKREKAIKIKQKSELGNTYNRSYQKWTKSEELFVKVRIQKIKSGQLSLDSATKGLNQLSGSMRSKDSIKRKLARLEGKK